MRILLSLLFLSPFSALGDVVTYASRASEAIIYPTGGQVTHQVSVTLPKGGHQIVLPDMPPNLELDGLRISAPGLRLGAVRYRSDLTPPRTDAETQAVASAKANIRQIAEQIQLLRDAADKQKLAAQAAEDRIEFLTALGDNPGLPVTPQALREIATMISEETLIARQTILDANISARGTLEQLRLLNEALETSKASLDALIPEPKSRPLLVLDVLAADAVSDVPLKVHYFGYDMSWQPTYTLLLSDTETDTPRLDMERGAQVTQSTGENWTNINLTLSTQSPGEQIDPSVLWPDPRRIFDPEELQIRRSTTLRAQSTDFADPIIEAPVIIQETRAATTIGTSGLALTYAFSDAVDIASGADSVRIPFDTLSFPTKLVARAVPLRDDTAFLVATFTNSSMEPLLPAFDSLRFYNNGLVGLTDFPEIAAGDEAEIAFGPINGLQLTRTVLGRSEGDRGLINRSNEQTEDIRITATNLTDREWQVDLRDRVPFSEQEELTITYTASPTPDTDSLDDKRGILQWQFGLGARATQTLITATKITWPEGQQLR